jgi:hypothetical protein
MYRVVIPTTRRETDEQSSKAINRSPGSPARKGRVSVCAATFWLRKCDVLAPRGGLPVPRIRDLLDHQNETLASKPGGVLGH